MNILIHLNTFHWEDHVSQMVELVLEHEKNGDKVFITYSKDIFKFCPGNQINKLRICNICIWIDGDIPPARPAGRAGPGGSYLVSA